MTRRRSITSIIGASPRSRRSGGSGGPSIIKQRKRKKDRCYCTKCKGKQVLVQTRILYESGNMNNSNSTEDELIESNENRDASITQETINQEIIEDDQLPQLPVDAVNTDEFQASTSASTLREFVENQSRQVIEYINDTDTKITEYSFIPRKRAGYISRSKTLSGNLYDESAVDDMSEFASEISGNESVNETSHAEIFEDYSPPPYQVDTDIEESSIDDQFSSILLWIMDFQIAYNLPETGTEELIKFAKQLLNKFSSNNNFPNSLYLAKKLLGLKDEFQSFVPCMKCHKLYGKQTVENFCKGGTLSVMKCQHIEFPNSSRRKSRICNTPLSRKIDDSTIQPELIFPFTGIQRQLAAMLRRPDFEKSLRHWSNRQQFRNIITDIYDREASGTFNDPNEVGASNYFQPK